MASRELRTIRECFSPAFTISPPQNSDSPFIFASPHSGRIYPRSFLDQSKLSPCHIRRSEDGFVEELFAHVTLQGAHLIYAHVPRAYLDLNRQPYELDPKLFPGKLPDFATSNSLKVKNGLGTIPRIVAQGREIYKTPPSLNEALQRINNLYFPYHGALHRLVQQQRKKHGLAVLFDCHSMPSQNGQEQGGKLPDFVLGNRFDKSCSYELTHHARSQLQALGYRVGVNKPYAGGHVTEKYGQPQNAIHVLQIEINRKLYLDEKTMEKTAGFEKLRQDLRIFTGKIIRHGDMLCRSGNLAAE